MNITGFYSTVLYVLYNCGYLYDFVFMFISTYSINVNVIPILRFKSLSRIQVICIEVTHVSTCGDKGTMLFPLYQASRLLVFL